MAIASSLRKELSAEFGDAFLGLLLVGSRARNDSDDQSDVDFEVIVEGAHVSERVVYRNGLRCELVIRSERLITQLMRQEPYVVERLADAIPIGVIHADVDILCRSAALARPLPRPEPSIIERFIWARRIRGGLDRGRRSNDIVSRVINRAEALRSALQLRFALAGRYVPRGRSIGAMLSALDSVEGAQAEEFCRAIAEAEPSEEFFRNVLAMTDPVGEREYAHMYIR